MQDLRRAEDVADGVLIVEQGGGPTTRMFGYPFKRDVPDIKTMCTVVE